MQNADVATWFEKLAADAHLELVEVPHRAEWLTMDIPVRDKALGWWPNHGTLTYCTTVVGASLRFVRTIDNPDHYLDYILCVAIGHAQNGDRSIEDTLPVADIQMAFAVQAHALDIHIGSRASTDPWLTWHREAGLDPTLTVLGAP